MPRFIAILGLLGLCVPATVCAQQTRPEVFRGFEAFVAEAIDDWKIPGIAVAVVQAGRPVYARGFGRRALGEEEAVTASTLFPLGGCTQPFTSYVLQILAEQGRLEWDRPLRDHIPELAFEDPYRARHMTARDLLCHRTGMASFDAVLPEGGSRAEIVRRLGRLPMDRPFRTGFHSSAAMEVLAAHLVERITGETWEKAVKSLVLEPLGMKRAAFGAAALAADPDAVRRHVERTGGVRRLAASEAVPGSAPWLNLSVEDAARWLATFLPVSSNDDSPLSAASCEPLYWPHEPVYWSNRDGFSPTFYGLGWGVVSYRARHYVRLGSFAPGSEVLFGFYPRHGLAYVILANKGGVVSLLSYLGFHLADRLLDIRREDGSREDWRARAKARRRSARAAVSTERPRAGRDRGEVSQRIAGDYDHPGAGTLRLTVEGGELRVRYAGASSPLVRGAEGRFLVVDDSAARLLDGATLRVGTEGCCATLRLPETPPLHFARRAR